MSVRGVTPILYVANSGKIGGGNRVLMDMIRTLDRRFEPSLVIPFEGPMSDWARSNAVALSIVPDGDLQGRVRMYSRGARIALIAQRIGAGIIHAIDPMCYRAAGVAGLLAGAARVCHVEFPPEAATLSWCLRYGPELIIACHEAQARQLGAALPPARRSCPVIALPNAVDTEHFKPLSDAGEVARDLRNGASHVVLIVGHLSEVKGYPTFLRAAALIARRLEGSTFLALGGETTTPGYRRHLESLAAELELGQRVRFLGFRDDVANVLQAADVVVLPSLAEGLPLCVLEAMACGKPVVATPVGGTPEAVVDGVTGRLVPPGHPERLAAAVFQILSDPARGREMGAAGRTRAELLFSLDSFSRRLGEAYDQLAAGHATQRRFAEPADAARRDAA